MAKANLLSGKGGLLDNGVAALAALSAAFAFYAMPEALFARLILASHIPDLVAAAHPPLGAKARLAVVLVVAGLAYAFVWTLMRALDSLGAPKAAPAPADEEAAPRLRRADAHPDAPSRRPLFAGRDLGDPYDDEPFELAPEAALAPDDALEPKPETVRAPQPVADWEPVPEHEQASAWAPVPEPDHARAWQPLPEPEQADAPAWEPEPRPEPAFEPEPVRARAPDPLPPFLVPQPDCESVEMPAPSHPAHPSFDEGEEEYDEDAAEEDGHGAETDDQSLARLMRRFESGLGRKQQALEPPHPGVPAPQPQPLSSDRGHRLRGAITDLGKISAPGR
ncbi:MAG TPA: hypothetical protein VFW19_14810 [Allosphingosinicella sp.]|nr:hypothetical protein [Allosphingosinicella sp.]